MYAFLECSSVAAAHKAAPAGGPLKVNWGDSEGPTAEGEIAAVRSDQLVSEGLGLLRQSRVTLSFTPTANW